jgi:transposase
MTTRPSTETLLLALDLGNTTWKLGFARAGAEAPPRLRTIPARDLTQLRAELATAKQRLGLFRGRIRRELLRSGPRWVLAAPRAHRAGRHQSRGRLSSIEVTRRARQAKSDRLDTSALLAKLARHVGGDRDVWSVVHVPSVEDEDRRQLHRELWMITRERTRVVNRIKGLLALHGVVLAERGLPRDLPPASALPTWDGAPLPAAAQARLEREWTPHPAAA